MIFGDLLLGFVSFGPQYAARKADQAESAHLCQTYGLFLVEGL
jgi:hypothetical protein